MPLFSVMRRGQKAVVVEAPNWIVAMGEGIPQLAGELAIGRLACEMLPNGTVIARDVHTGQGYVILPLGDSAGDKNASEPPASTDVEEILEAAPELTGPLPADPEEEELQAELQEVTDAESPISAWQAALGLLADQIPCEAATAVEATPRAGLLFCVVIGPDAHKLKALRLPYGAGFVGLCVDQGIGLRVSDAQQDQRHYAAVDEATGFETRTILCVPVVSAQVCYGCLELINASEGRFFRGDGDLAERVAEVLALRLERGGVSGRLLSSKGA